ncbi:MAG: hypothetical protein HY812_15635 [Planctomycetes bacterium]|nr:hypothetical protein [Planctomycetota bacterium]
MSFRAASTLLLFLGLALVLAPGLSAQGKNKKWAPPDPGDAPDVTREHGVGTIRLGGSARGDIVLGFYNMITFEAVKGTRVTLRLSTRHKEAELLADLIDPRRASHVAFVPAPENARDLVLADHLLEMTGVYSIRFGFKTDHNGSYLLETSAVFPASAEETLELAAHGEVRFAIDGMADRRIGLLKVEPDEGMRIDLRLLDPSGCAVDVRAKTRFENFGRRTEVADVVIESNGEFELIVRETAGVKGMVRVAVEFKNPPLSRRVSKI